MERRVMPTMYVDDDDMTFKYQTLWTRQGWHRFRSDNVLNTISRWIEGYFRNSSLVYWPHLLGSDVGWTKADNLALAGVLATIVGVFLSATLTTWLQRWQLVRSQAHSNQRVDVEAGYRADTCLRVTLERQAVAHLANNSSNESFFSAAQELEETQPIDETVFYVGDTIAMPMPPPIAHLRS